MHLQPGEGASLMTLSRSFVDCLHLSNDCDHPVAVLVREPVNDVAATEKKDLRQLLTLGRSFWTVNLVFMLDGAGYFGVLNVLEFFLGKDGLKLSDHHATILISVLSGALTIFAALFGKLVDKKGVRYTIVATIVCALAGRLILLAAPSWNWRGSNTIPYLRGVQEFFLNSNAVTASVLIALVALLMMAFSAGLMQSAVYAGVRQMTTKATEATGYALPYALMNLGIVLVSLVSPFIRERWHAGGVIFACALLALVYLGVQLVGWREPQIAVRKVGDEKEPPATEKRAGRHPLFNPRFLFFIFVLLGVRTLFAHQFLTMPLYIERSYSKAIGARYEWLTGINPVIVFIGTPIVAIVTRKIHVVNMMIVGTLISAGATVFLMFGANFWALIAYFLVFSLGECLWSSRFYEWVTKTAPKNQVGVYMGVAGVPWFLAKLTTGFYAGRMLMWLCPEDGPGRTGLLWLIYGAIGLTSPVGLLLARRWLIRGTLEEQAT